MIKHQLKQVTLLILCTVPLSIAISAILALILKGNTTFYSIIFYFIGVITTIIITFSIKRHICDKGYFTYSQLEQNSNFWVERIKQKKYINKKTAYLSSLPYLILSIAIILLIVIFYKRIQNNGTELYIGYAVISSLLSSMATALIAFYFIQLKSFKICKSCGVVNAFIYSDDDIQHIAITSFGDYRTPGWRGAGDMSAMRAITKQHGNSATCHCANCNNDSIITETYDSMWSGL